MARRITCGCGKHILVDEDYPHDRGKCPRCGKMLLLRPQGQPAPSRPAPRPARHGLWLAYGATAVSALIAIPALLLAISLHGRNAELAEQIEALQAQGATETPVPAAPPDRATAPRRKAAAPSADLSGLHTRIEQLNRRLEALGSRKPAPEPTPLPPSAVSLETALTRLARVASPAVVAIATERGAGSGVVISADGYILTNDHVVGGRRRIVAHFPSGERRQARLLGKDAVSDVALIKVAGEDLPFMRLGDSDALQIGQVVVALGNPFGLSRDGKPTMTLGIVSALHRIVTPGKGQRRYGDAIQTDAAINPGNSGGALVDLRGRLIGINGAISSRTGTSSGVGFAIPVNFVKRVLPTLKAGRSTQPGFLGINVRDMSQDETSRSRLRGAVVTQVAPASPAALAGLRPGHLITHFQGKPVRSSTELINQISYYQAGSEVAVVAMTRNGKRELKMRIASRNQIYQRRR